MPHDGLDAPVPEPYRRCQDEEAHGRRWANRRRGIIAKRWTATGALDFGRMIERMPDDAPPKWMFRNITTIRENTDASWSSSRTSDGRGCPVRVLVVYAHYNPDSFTHALRDELTAASRKGVTSVR